MKRYLVDGAVGFAVALALFFAVPLLWHTGNWGFWEIGAFQSLLLGLFFFLLYNQTPPYKKLHAPGARPFSAAFTAYLAGAIVGYGAVLFIAAFSVSQWSPAL